jgi:Repeat of unknown function (DUF5648)/Divergent InlB B-repeat domain
MLMRKYSVIGIFLLGLLLGAPTALFAQSRSTCEAYLASNRSPAGLPAVSGPGASQRSTLLADSTSKLVIIGSRYYTITIPAAFYAATTPVVIFDLPGTGGYPEASWNDWHTSTAARGYAHVSLMWGGGTMTADTDTQIYTNLKQMISDVGASCPIASARKWLMGFSVGSAYSFAIMIRDVADQKKFYGQIALSGAAIGPMTTGRDLMHPTVEANRANVNAVTGTKSWMYCGALDFDHVWSMCTEMPNGETFVNTHGGTATLYQDPTGTHNSLPTSPAGYNQMFDFLVAAATPCSAGTYSATGNTPCTNASAGNFVAAGGATAQTACAIGSFQPSAGASACTLASAGSYVGTSGATAQIQCAAGSFASNTGSSSCTLASVGFFVPLSGATAQTPCATGTSSTVSGATACAAIIYTVTPSATTNGSISPATPQAVNSGASISLNVTANVGYTAAVSGTCGGTLNGSTYTTNLISANCTIVATFTLIPVVLTPQVIIFGATPLLAAGGTAQLSASGGASGNPISFSSTTTSVCTVSGTTVTGISAGACTIVANQAGSVSHAAAAAVTLILNVTASPTLANFSSQSNVALNTVIVSNTVSISGLSTPTTIALNSTSSTSAAYSIGCTSVFSSQPSTVSAGQNVCMRVTSGANSGDITTASLTVGTSTLTFSVTTANPEAQNRYRIYIPSTGGHLFTTDKNEYEVLIKLSTSYVDEGIDHKIFLQSVTKNNQKTVPYYRLYIKTVRQHFWTTDANEYNVLRAQTAFFGDEAIDGYLFLSAGVNGAVPLYRLALANTAIHHWTIDKNEYDFLVKTGTWIGEGAPGNPIGVTGYVLPK